MKTMIADKTKFTRINVNTTSEIQTIRKLIPNMIFNRSRFHNKLPLNKNPCPQYHQAPTGRLTSVSGTTR